MKFIIIGKNIDVTPGLKEAVESKLGKLQRYFTPDTEIHVTLSVQKEHQKIEVTIPVKGNIIRSEQESDDMYVSIDLVEEVIERQLRKYKNKLVARNQEGNNFSKALFETEEPIEDGEIKIVRTKRFGIKPMYPEDACVQMELLGHNFFVFFNAENEEVNVEKTDPSDSSNQNSHKATSKIENKNKTRKVFIFSWSYFYFSIWRLPWPR